MNVYVATFEKNTELLNNLLQISISEPNDIDEYFYKNNLTQGNFIKFYNSADYKEYVQIDNNHSKSNYILNVNSFPSSIIPGTTTLAMRCYTDRSMRNNETMLFKIIMVSSNDYRIAPEVSFTGDKGIIIGDEVVWVSVDLNNYLIFSPYETSFGKNKFDPTKAHGNYNLKFEHKITSSLTDHEGLTGACNTAYNVSPEYREFWGECEGFICDYNPDTILSTYEWKSYDFPSGYFSPYFIIERDSSSTHSFILYVRKLDTDNYNIDISNFTNSDLYTFLSSREIALYAYKNPNGTEWITPPVPTPVTIDSSLNVSFYLESVAYTMNFSCGNLSDHFYAKYNINNKSFDPLSTPIIQNSYVSYYTLLNAYSFVTQGVISDYISLQWQDGYNTVGTFSLVLADSEQARDIIKLNRYLFIEKSDKVMIIEKVKFNANLMSDGYVLEVSGRSLESILDRRVAFPGVSLDTYVCKSEKGLIHGLYKLVHDFFIDPTKNAVVSSDGETYFYYPQRQVSFIDDSFLDTTEDNDGYYSYNSSLKRPFNNSINKSVAKDSLLKIIEEQCQQSNLGFKIVPYLIDGDSRNVVWRFILYTGADKSYTRVNKNDPLILFSPKLNNVVSVSTVDDNSNYKNAIFCGTEKDADTYIDLTTTLSVDINLNLPKVISGVKEQVVAKLTETPICYTGVLYLAIAAARLDKEYNYTVTNISSYNYKKNVYKGFRTNLGRTTLAAAYRSYIYVNQESLKYLIDYNINPDSHNYRFRVYSYSNNGGSTYTNVLDNDWGIWVKTHKYTALDPQDWFMNNAIDSDQNIFYVDPSRMYSGTDNAILTGIFNEYQDYLSDGLNTASNYILRLYDEEADKAGSSEPFWEVKLMFAGDSSISGSSPIYQKYILIRQPTTEPELYDLNTYDTGYANNREYLYPTKMITKAEADNIVVTYKKTYGDETSGNAKLGKFTLSDINSENGFKNSTAFGWLTSNVLKQAIQDLNNTTWDGSTIIGGLVNNAEKFAIQSWFKSFDSYTSNNNLKRWLCQTYVENSKLTGLDRREVFVEEEKDTGDDWNASAIANWSANTKVISTDDADDDDSDEKINERLKESARKQASDYRKEHSVDADCQMFNYDYLGSGDNGYELGDLVQIDDGRGNVEKKIISAVTIANDTSSGFKIVPVFSDYTLVPKDYQQLDYIQVANMILPATFDSSGDLVTDAQNQELPPKGYGLAADYEVDGVSGILGKESRCPNSIFTIVSEKLNKVTEVEFDGAYVQKSSDPQPLKNSVALISSIACIYSDIVGDNMDLFISTPMMLLANKYLDFINFEFQEPETQITTNNYSLYFKLGETVSFSGSIREITALPKYNDNFYILKRIGQGYTYNYMSSASNRFLYKTVSDISERIHAVLNKIEEEELKLYGKVGDVAQKVVELRTVTENGKTEIKKNLRSKAYVDETCIMDRPQVDHYFISNLSLYGGKFNNVDVHDPDMQSPGDYIYVGDGDFASCRYWQRIFINENCVFNYVSQGSYVNKYTLSTRYYKTRAEEFSGYGNISPYVLSPIGDNNFGQLRYNTDGNRQLHFNIILGGFAIEDSINSGIFGESKLYFSSGNLNENSNYFDYYGDPQNGVRVYEIKVYEYDSSTRVMTIDCEGAGNLSKVANVAYADEINETTMPTHQVAQKTVEVSGDYPDPNSRRLVHHYIPVEYVGSNDPNITNEDKYGLYDIIDQSFVAVNWMWASNGDGNYRINNDAIFIEAGGRSDNI